jgi:serine protease Do
MRIPIFLLCAVLLVPTVARAELNPADLNQLDFRKIIAGAKQKVFPAVVFIKVLSESYEGGKKTTSEASGSGVLISGDGEVVTNWHVVDKAVDVRCLLFDGQAFDAEIVGSDKDTDLALLRLKRPAGAPSLPYAVIGDSTAIAEGDFVMAMGAPWGLSRSVSLGIISCTRRYLPEASEYSLWLQTDASISPGNSGGPLVNTVGEVIGINARGVMQGGDMGFAIPAETVVEVVRQLREFGRVNWSWTGLRLQPLKDFNRNMYFEGDEGVIVADTDPDSPARSAGFQPRDRIVRIGETPIVAMTDEDLPLLRRMLGLLPKEKPATIELLRDGKPMTLELTPREKGKVQGDELDCPRWDFTVKAINQFENPDLFFHRREGVFVYGIKYPGNAGNSGLQSQDILLKIGSDAVKSLDDVKALHEKAMTNIDREHRIVITVLRNGLMKQVVLDYSRDFAKE